MLFLNMRSTETLVEERQDVIGLKKHLLKFNKKQLECMMTKLFPWFYLFQHYGGHCVLVILLI